MSVSSAHDVLILHAVRIKGMADERAVAARYGLPVAVTSELLADFEAYGWIRQHAFGDTGGWSLTAAGKSRNERQLSEELAETGGREAIETTYADFLPKNALLQRASTNWQVRPSPHDPLAHNMHNDRAWDAAVLTSLRQLHESLGDLEARLVSVLSRFLGYQARFGVAVDRTRAGDLNWVTGVGIDSCHTVWMELHEDLLATLNRERTASR